MNAIIKFFKNHGLAGVIIFSLLFGVGGGIIGGIIFRSYFIDASYGLSPFGSLDFSQGKLRDQGFVISNAKNVIVQQDAKINETVNSVANSLVGIYKKQKPAKSGRIFALENFYKLGDAVGQGFIITSDGWIVTGMPLDKNYSDYVVITKDKKIYQIDKAAADSLTNFNFIHVAARDLPVRGLAENKDIKKGNLTVSVNWLGSSWISSVLGYSEKNVLIKSSDGFSRELILNESVPQEFRNSIIFNLNGDALGIADAKGNIELMSHLKGAAGSLFKNKAISRPALGINYIDLSQLAIAGSQSDYWQKGAVIYKDQKGVAVQKNSAAAQAGLREGDIIISVDDVSLNGDSDLAEIIQNYAPGDKVNLAITRDGNEKDIEVTLLERK